MESKNTDFNESKQNSQDLKKTTTIQIRNNVLNVSEITRQIKSILESDFSYVEVQGEISNFTIQQSSGHIYFKLKDDSALLSCVFFRHKNRRCPITSRLKDGDKIIAKGSINIYEKNGSYSLNLESCEYSGIGELYLQHEALKNSLQAQGYFDNARKKPIPRFPKRIVLLTSSSGAALHDIIKVAKNRYCICEFILINTLVQGRDAKHSISKNIAIADNLGADMIVLARGGGSFEDLYCFSEIETINAIIEAKTPVVSAIGHDWDYMISDFVADVRAATPSAAMEMILPDKNSLLQHLMDLEKMIEHSMSNLMGKKRENFLSLSQHIEILSPVKKLIFLKEKSKALQNNLKDSINYILNAKKTKLESLKSQISVLKPVNKIEKIRTKLQNLNLMLNESMANFLRLKYTMIKASESSLAHAFSLYVMSKKSSLDIDINTPLISFIAKKRSTLVNLSELIANINPQNRVQKGFVQILKNNQIVEIKELKSGDNIELIDHTATATATIL